MYQQIIVIYRREVRRKIFNSDQTYVKVNIDISEFFSVAATGPNAKSLNVRLEQNNLETANKELDKARSRMKTHLLHTMHDVTRREERASTLANTGGSPGM